MWNRQLLNPMRICLSALLLCLLDCHALSLIDGALIVSGSTNFGSNTWRTVWEARPMGLIISQASADEVSFHRQVVPLLTRAGCNAGACHGAATGRGGLHLSLFGSDPSEDYRAIVEQLEGRRIHHTQFDKSLLLRKPLGELDHGGDQVFDTDSPEYRTLRTWISQGAKLDERKPISGIQVEVNKLDENQTPSYQLKVLAALNHPVGRPSQAVHQLEEKLSIDITSLVQITLTDPESANLNLSLAQVRLLRPGRHVIIVRYQTHIQAVTLTLPYSTGTQFANLEARNFIDREINAALGQLNLAPAAQISDAEYLRRVTIDLAGRLPDIDEAKSFLQSDNLDKRQRAVDRLLASPAFNDYWTLVVSRWLRLHSLPNETQGVDSFGNWIRESIASGESWREMTRQLVTATGDSHVIGPANLCRMVGDARTHAELVSEVFLGARMGCANCHDHPLDRWTQADYHGLAAMLSRIDRGRNVQLTARGDVTNPKTSLPARWRLPGERDVDEKSPPLETLAQWLTDPDQPRLSLTYTNRIWSEMFGRGLVEAVDDLRDTNPATHPELLRELARQVVQRDYDLRSLLHWIVSTKAYARESSASEDAFYRVHQTRQMTAHVLADAIADVTSVPMKLERLPDGSRAVHLLDPLAPAVALDVLGRCNRAAACTTSEKSIGLATQLHLINGELINGKLNDPHSRLMRMMDSQVATAEIIDEFHWRAFGELMSEAERDRWVQQLDHQDPRERKERLQDWLWSVLSSRKFQQR